MIGRTLCELSSAHDAETFPAADPQGFFVGTLEGEPVASISVVKYEPGFAFLGLYIVRPEWRGRGLGRALWQHGMASAAGRQVGLDGVVAQQPNYRKSGFEMAWRNVPFSAVCAYDNAYFPAERAAFLRTWLTQPDAAARGWIEDGRLQGYGLVRRCRSGWKIGPLLAERKRIAECLFLALCSRAGVAEPVYLDLPEANATAVALAKRHHMRMVFETARMYTGQPLAVTMHGLYGVTTFELG